MIEQQEGGEEKQEDPLQGSEPVLVQCVFIGQCGSEGGEKVFDYAVPVGQWTHLVFMFEKSSQCVRLIVNGALADSVDKLRLSLPQSVVGSSKPGHSFTGLLAELRIWASVRSPREVRREMFCGVTPCHGLVSLLHFKHEQLGSGLGSVGAVHKRPPPSHVLDEVGLNGGRLIECALVASLTPNTAATRCPPFMPQEADVAEGVCGEGWARVSGCGRLLGVCRMFRVC